MTIDAPPPDQPPPSRPSRNPRIVLPGRADARHRDPGPLPPRIRALRRLRHRFMATIHKLVPDPALVYRQDSVTPADVRAAIMTTARFFDMHPASVALHLTGLGLMAPPEAYPSSFIALVGTHAQGKPDVKVPTLLDEPDGENLATEMRLILGLPHPALRRLGEHWIATGQANWTSGGERTYTIDALAAELRPRPHLARFTERLLEQASKAGERREHGRDGDASSDLEIYAYPMSRYIEMFFKRYEFCRAALLNGSGGRINPPGTVAIIGQIAGQYAVTPDYVLTRLSAHPDFRVPSLEHLPDSFVALVRAHDQLDPQSGGGYYPRPFADYETQQGIFGQEPKCYARQPHPFYRALAERWRREGLAADWPAQKPLPPDIAPETKPAPQAQSALTAETPQRVWDQIAARHLTPERWADHAHDRAPFTAREIERLFVGQKVEVARKQATKNIGGKDMVFDTYAIAPDDATMLRLDAAARKAGLTPRVWLPDRFLDMQGYTPDRLNVHVRKTGDDSWRIHKVELG